MKTEFELIDHVGRMVGHAKIIDTPSSDTVYVSFQVGITLGHLDDNDLEKFAVNILKAIKSKKLKV